MRRASVQSETIGILLLDLWAGVENARRWKYLEIGKAVKTAGRKLHVTIFVPKLKP
jgi:hypothetical protein